MKTSPTSTLKSLSNGAGVYQLIWICTNSIAIARSPSTFYYSSLDFVLFDETIDLSSLKMAIHENNM